MDSDYNFYNRLVSIFDLDNIRFLKMIEIIQYTVVFFIITVMVTKFLNKYLFYKPEETIEKQALEMSFTRLLFSIAVDLIIVIIAFFYIRKISLLVPSIATYLSADFKGYTTLEYSIHVALVFVFLEIVKGLKHKIEVLKSHLV